MVCKNGKDTLFKKNKSLHLKKALDFDDIRIILILVLKQDSIFWFDGAIFFIYYSKK